MSANVRSESDILSIFDQFRNDFLCQEVVVQHPYFASFNQSSLNTMRIVTYRNPRKNIRVLYAGIRFGSEGSDVDNSSSGGGCCAIDSQTGLLYDRKVHKYKKIETSNLPPYIDNEVPFFFAAKQSVLELHKQLPNFDLIGWDIAINSEGHPVFIELNVRPDICLGQHCIGPIFTDEELDELMERIKQRGEYYLHKPTVTFADKWRFEYNDSFLF